jgi:hypothetical protein
MNNYATSNFTYVSSAFKNIGKDFFDRAISSVYGYPSTTKANYTQNLSLIKEVFSGKPVSNFNNSAKQLINANNTNHSFNKSEKTVIQLFKNYIKNIKHNSNIDFFTNDFVENYVKVDKLNINADSIIFSMILLLESKDKKALKNTEQLYNHLYEHTINDLTSKSLNPNHVTTNLSFLLNLSISNNDNNLGKLILQHEVLTQYLNNLPTSDKLYFLFDTCSLCIKKDNSDLLALLINYPGAEKLLNDSKYSLKLIKECIIHNAPHSTATLCDNYINVKNVTNKFLSSVQEDIYINKYANRNTVYDTLNSYFKYQTLNIMLPEKENKIGNKKKI